MRSERQLDELAENYDRREEIRGDPLEPWLRRALPPGGKAAVDVACGAGRHTIVLAQSRPHAVELYRLESDPAWTAHLATDRYLSRSEFERRYTIHFPGAAFHRAQHLHICAWEDR